MTYQLLSKENYLQQCELGFYAFNIEATEERKIKLQTVIDHSLSVGAFHEENLSAQVMITPYTVSFHQSEYQMGGIGMVSSYPENRGTGDVANLMKLSLKTMNEKGMDLSYLAPFSYSFYRKYGFEQVFDHVKTILTPEQLPRIKTRTGKLERVTWTEGQESLKSLYAEQTKQTVGAVKREDWWWDYSFHYYPKKKIVLYKNEQNKPEGYLVYQFNDNTFELTELIYETHTAYEMLWGFVSTHSSSFQFFEYESQTNENNVYLLNNPYVKQEYTPFMMGRIVNFQRFVQNFPFIEACSKELYLQVSDDTAPWNDGIWCLSFTDKQPTLVHLDTNQEHLNLENKLVLEGTIQTWTQVLFGYRTASELHFFNRLKGNEETIAILESMLPKGTPVLYDYF